jgi:hypothetical protein
MVTPVTAAPAGQAPTRLASGREPPMAATQTALNARPAFAAAMWLGQRSHTSIGAGTAGSYRSRPSSPAWPTTYADPAKPG